MGEGLLKASNPSLGAGVGGMLRVAGYLRRRGWEMGHPFSASLRPRVAEARDGKRRWGYLFGFSGTAGRGGRGSGFTSKRGVIHEWAILEFNIAMRPVLLSYSFETAAYPRVVVLGELEAAGGCHGLSAARDDG